MTAPAVDDLTLTVGGAAISGWTEIRVTRGIEICPTSFDIAMTDLYPGQAAAVVVHAGDPCTVKLGDDLVVTGYVDTVEPSYSGDNHEIRVTGRGKCQDLVDCSAERPTGQFKGLNVLTIAQELAAPYGIQVTSYGEPPGGPVVPQFNLMIGESPYDIIERICRWAALLCYEGTDGNLILSGVQRAEAKSGLVEGRNVQAASARLSMNERYSEIDVYLQALDVWSDVGDGGNQVGKATDPNVPRNRRKAMIADGGALGLSLAQTRATWEIARRQGRAAQFSVTVDSWRDIAFNLWTPNTSVPFSLPSLKTIYTEALLSEVTYYRDRQGTRAQLVLMPPAAFIPEPILLQPIAPDVVPTGPAAP